MTHRRNFSLICIMPLPDKIAERQKDCITNKNQLYKLNLLKDVSAVPGGIHAILIAVHRANTSLSKQTGDP